MDYFEKHKFQRNLFILAILLTLLVIFIPKTPQNPSYVSCEEAVRLVWSGQTGDIIATPSGVFSISLTNGTHVVLNGTEANKPGCNFAEEVSSYYNELQENCTKTNTSCVVPIAIGIE
ncbi:hypothetical protein H0N98_03255 [Candidatus Micrarchaeota archaeon]|nr:hypothetical protein [Candidatus Micrarchaeota archaeon]